MAKQVKANKETAVPLTQANVNAILAADPKRGRSEIARELGIPDAQVWAVRGAAGLLKISPEAVTHCKARLARAGVVIAKPKAPRKRTAAPKK